MPRCAVEVGQKKGRRRSGDDPAMICLFDGREMGAGAAGGRPLRVSVKKNLLISRPLPDVPVFLLFLVWKYVAVSYLCTPQTKGCGQFFEAWGRVFCGWIEGEKNILRNILRKWKKLLPLQPRRGEGRFRCLHAGVSTMAEALSGGIEVL